MYILSKLSFERKHWILLYWYWYLILKFWGCDNTSGYQFFQYICLLGINPVTLTCAQTCVLKNVCRYPSPANKENFWDV